MASIANYPSSTLLSPRVLRGENCWVVPQQVELARFTIWAERGESPRFRPRLRALRNVSDKVATRMVLFVSTFRRGHAVFTVLGVYDALNYPVCNKTRGGTRIYATVNK